MESRKNMRNPQTALQMSIKHLEKHDSSIPSYKSRRDFWLEIEGYARQRADDIQQEVNALNVERMNRARAEKKAGQP